MRQNSRLVSPAGFALVLLLFLLLPFLSVSCEAPGVGTIGADYTGAQLAVGATPDLEVPPDLVDLADEVPGGAGNSEPPPDPGVAVFAIVAAVLMAAGVAAVAVRRARVRLVGGAALAVVAAVAVVLTQVVAQANLSDQLRADLTDLIQGQASPTEPAPDADAAVRSELDLAEVEQIVEEMPGTEVGFWLTLVGLLLIAAVNVGLLVRDRIATRPAPE